MPKFCQLVCTIILLAVPIRSQGNPQHSSQLPALQIHQGIIVDEALNPVVLRGCNLGNWLVLEMWMLDLADAAATDQYQLEQLLVQRFGEAEKSRLLDLYREHWITRADFERIQSFDMNLVRLPFEYGLLMDEGDDPPYVLKPDAWRWLDHAIGLAEQHGLYTLLDLHGAPGRQSAMDHTGRRDLNQLWSSEADQARTVWLWKQIARRYRDRSSVFAYDLLNEPWGGTKEQLGSLIGRLFDAVRTVDSESIIILPGHYDGIGLYGDPRDDGWENYIFTMHWYPGFFGWGRPGLHVHKDFLEGGIVDWGKRMRGLQAPLLVGEFNVVHKQAGGGEMMRRYFDAYESLGWPATLWSYKVLTRSGGIGSGVWGMVTNTDPLPPLDLSRDPIEAIEKVFRSYAGMPMTLDEDLRHWLTTDATPSVLDDLPPLPPPMREAPDHHSLPAPWQSTDLDGSRPGGQTVSAPDEFVIYGGGNDIWNQKDQFRFTWQTVTGDLSIATQILELEDTHPYAKAGIMIRDSLDANASHAVLNVFPGGGLEWGHRPTRNAPMLSVSAGQASFPEVHIKLVRQGASITAFTARESNAWRSCGTVTLPELKDIAWVGLVTLSHDNEVLTRARFRDPTVTLRIP